MNLETVLTGILALLAIAVSQRLKRLRWARKLGLEDLGAVVCAGLALLGALLGAAILPRIFSELPADLKTWTDGAWRVTALAVVAYQVWSRKIRRPPGRG